MAPSFYFSGFHLDPTEQQLFRDGEPGLLAPKEFHTLLLLVRNSGHVVTKEQIAAEVWPNTFVGDTSIARNVSVIRKVLGPGFIETFPKRGYRYHRPGDCRS